MTMEDGTMCGDWSQEQILDHLQGRLPAEESARFRGHSEACASCRSAVAELSVIADLASQRVRPSRAAEDGVLAAIRAEAARRSSRPSKPATRRRLRRLAGTPTPTAAAWIFAAAALFMVVVVSAMISSTPSAPPAPVTRVTPAPSPEPTPMPAVAPEPPRPIPTPAVSPEPPKPAPKPVDVPRDPTPAPPEPVVPPPAAPKPKPPTVPETRPAAVEVARVVRAGGKHAAGDRILSGDAVQCATGVLLLETADRSQIALKAGTTLTPEAQGDHLTLRLAEGEVACSVRPHADRRFAVATTHGSALVKGTIFAVRATGVGTTITVAKGRVEARTEAGALDVAGGERCSMSRSTSPGRPESVNADRLLSWAYDAGLSTPGTMWLLAGGPAAEFQAPMTRGRLFAAGSLSGEPVFAAVDSRTLPSWNGRSLTSAQKDGGWVTYTIDLPETGPWHLWGRFYSPGSGTTLWKQDAEPRENDPNSFYVSVDGGKEHVFGNNKSDPEAKVSGYRRWYWGGDGSIEVGRPAALSLGTLTKGRHTIRIRNRDAVETASLHLAPRLDALCLTLDKEYRPRDEDFRR